MDMFPTNDSAKSSGYVSENGHTQMTFHLSLVPGWDGGIDVKSLEVRVLKDK